MSGSWCLLLATVLISCATPSRSTHQQGLFDYLSDRGKLPASPEDWGPRIPHDRVVQSIRDWQWPLQKVQITSEYGIRRGRKHEGIDLGAKKGTPVFAVQDGIVLHADNKLSGYGNLVIIEHPSGLMTLYAHNSKMFVNRGDSVKKGHTIALVGKTGYASGPHLHFEIRNQGEAIDPLDYMDPDDRSLVSER